jgi:cytoskeletal protein CcmA (bactofilin family)
MSVPCPKCNKALKVEDVTIKSYLPVNDLQTCGRIFVTKTGRIVAKLIRCGDGIECEGTIEGAIESDGKLVLGAKSSWKGQTLFARSLELTDGAKLVGYVKVPYAPPKANDPTSNEASAKDATNEQTKNAPPVTEPKKRGGTPKKQPPRPEQLTLDVP